VNNVCIGPEFGTDPTTNALIVRNTQAGSWPYGTGCPPSGASGLRKDPALGLWVDPVNLTAFHDVQPLVASTDLALNAYTSTGIPALTLTNPSACLPMQVVLWHTFRCHGTVPLHSYVLEKLWVGPDADTQPADASLSTYDTYHCWTDAAAEFAFSATLIRRVGLAPAASVTLDRYMSLYCVNMAGGSTVPTLIDGGVETTGFGFTQLAPVTDLVT
jgi:hypothetical protein